jgi:hypothetical protein
MEGEALGAEGLEKIGGVVVDGLGDGGLAGGDHAGEQLGSRVAGRVCGSGRTCGSGRVGGHGQDVGVQPNLEQVPDLETVEPAGRADQRLTNQPPAGGPVGRQPQGEVRKCACPGRAARGQVDAAQIVGQRRPHRQVSVTGEHPGRPLGLGQLMHERDPARAARGHERG